MKIVTFSVVAAVGVISLSACQTTPPPSAPLVSPKNTTSTYTQHDMIATANPMAAAAGREILRAGGSAVDATIAAQMVLTLVEPQSSGIGGGAFLMHYDKRSGAVDSYDGRETAPRSATPEMFLKTDGTRKKFYDAAVGGSSVGVPGVMRMLEIAHRDHGKLPWKDLFQPAITLAENGFVISPRLAELIAKDRYLKTIPGTKAYFYENDGSPKTAGTVLKNPDLVVSFKTLAEKGASALYEGEIAEGIVNTVRHASKNPSGMTIADMVAYQAKKRPPVCMDYHQWKVCGMGPPSSGGLTTLQILGIVEQFDMGTLQPFGANAVHLIAEASALAFGDRNTYIADPDQIPVPTLGLINKGYLQIRAGEISKLKAGGKRFPGMPGLSGALNFAPSENEHGLSTTHMSIIDGEGNAVSMTSSIENAFGSRLMSGGFLLNNQLTDFSFYPSRKGVPIANRAGPGKRPRSSMSPTLVLDESGKLVMAIGSPGGSRIIGYVAKTVIAALDWKMDMDAAIDAPNFVNLNGSTDLEKGTALESLKPALENMGHKVKLVGMTSGLHGIRVTKYGLEGGADRRREGVAIGD